MAETPTLESQPGGAWSGIHIWNRKTGKLEVETVYGERLMRAVYTSGPGKVLLETLLIRKWLSGLYGFLQTTRRSAAKIGPFVEKFQIPMDEFETGTPFKSFNDFFIRTYKPGLRPFATAPGKMPAFAEGRYYAFKSVAPGQTFPVKGTNLDPQKLLGNADLARDFEGGPAFIARLCPVDYHRYHYPDAGKTLAHYTVHGKYHSVNPIALQAYPEVFIENERRISILDTENFGTLAYVEVGALMVGKIVQTADEGLNFKRGDEKGYFLFGGSTVVVLGQKGAWAPSADLVEKTEKGIETRVLLGDEIASRI